MFHFPFGFKCSPLAISQACIICFYSCLKITWHFVETIKSYCCCFGMPRCTRHPCTSSGWATIPLKQGPHTYTNAHTHTWETATHWTEILHIIRVCACVYVFMVKCVFVSWTTTTTQRNLSQETNTNNTIRISLCMFFFLLYFAAHLCVSVCLSLACHKILHPTHTHMVFVCACVYNLYSCVLVGVVAVAIAATCCIHCYFINQSWVFCLCIMNITSLPYRVHTKRKKATFFS